MFGLFVSSKLDWGSYIVAIAKTSSRKNATLIRSMKLLFYLLSFFSMNLLHSLDPMLLLCLRLCSQVLLRYIG